MSCQGEPIEMEDLRTEGQQNVMANLGALLMPNIGKTRAPYPGMLSAPPDQAQLAAMDTMMGLGARAYYNAPQFNMGPGLRVGPAAGAVSGGVGATRVTTIPAATGSGALASMPDSSVSMTGSAGTYAGGAGAHQGAGMRADAGISAAEPSTWPSIFPFRP